jgi:hypothetical protein
MLNRGAWIGTNAIREHWITRYSARGFPYQVRQSEVPWIDPSFLECAVYLYPSEKEAEDGDRIGGTGFVVGFQLGGEGDLSRPIVLCVVTNKHVVDAGNATVRLNTMDGRTDIIPLDGARWYFHPDGDDLAVIPIKLSNMHKVVYRFIPSSRFLTKEISKGLEIGPGDDVFIVGRFVNHEGRQRNIPSLRFGNIAQMPWEPIKIDGREQESFIIEARSISGYSGSPVFVYISPQVQASNWNPEIVKRVKEGKLKIPGVPKSRFGLPIVLGPWLLGIDYCHIRWDEPIWSKATGRANDDWFIKSNTGMMGVVPVWKLTEILEGTEMRPVMDEVVQIAARAAKDDSSIELNLARPDNAKE